METNGKTYRRHGLYVLMYIVLAACSLVVGFLAGGCSSSRSAVREISVVGHAVSNVSERDTSDSSRTDEGVHQRDSIGGDSGECGLVSIERDSAGRPTVIFWQVHRSFSAQVANETTSEVASTSYRKFSASDASAAEDTFAAETEETETKVSPALPIENLLGYGIMAIVLLYIAYSFIKDHLIPWIRKDNR